MKEVLNRVPCDNKLLQMQLQCGIVTTVHAVSKLMFGQIQKFGQCDPVGTILFIINNIVLPSRRFYKLPVRQIEMF